MPPAHGQGMSGVEWPELPRIPPPIETFPDNPTKDDLLRVFGQTLFDWGHVWPRVAQALEYLKNAHDEAWAWMRAHNDAHLDASARPSAGNMILPPMRERFESTHETALSVASDIARAYEAELRNPSTPPIPSPSKIEEMIKLRVESEVAHIKQAEEAAKWRAVEAERKAAEQDRLARRDDERALAALKDKYRLRAKWAVIFGLITTTFTAIGWVLEHFHK